MQLSGSDHGCLYGKVYMYVVAGRRGGEGEIW